MSVTDRWAEIVTAAYEGLAMIDAAGRFVFASGPALASLGVEADELLGRHLVDAIPELGIEDFVAFVSATPSGGRVRSEIDRRTDDGFVSLRLTFVPRHDEHGGFAGMIMLSHDVTALRVAHEERRRAQHRLTAVEEEEQRRVSRAIHDGPIQILAALALRLGAMTRCESAPGVSELDAEVIAAGEELRAIFVEPDADPGDPPTLLARWAAPLLDGTNLELELDDDTAAPPNRPTAEALFVFLHEVITAAPVTTSPRRLHARLTQAGGGYQLTMTIPHGTPEPARGADLRVQVRAAKSHARNLGGSFEHEASDDARTITAWLPELDDDQDAPADHPPVRPVAGASAAAVRCSDDRHPVLTDADLATIAAALHEGLMELDRHFMVTFANELYAKAMKRPAAELTGLPFAAIFHPDDYERLRPYVEEVGRGKPMRFEWLRRNAAGEHRWAQVAAVPRFDDENGFNGAVVLTLDTTELHRTEDLREGVLRDLRRARRAATRAILRRLDEGPIRHLAVVNDRLQTLIRDSPAIGAISVIRDELERSIDELRKSVLQLAEPDTSERDWDEALRSLLADVLDERCELVILDRTDGEPSGAQAAALLRIARAAVANAYLHGRATRVTVSLDRVGGDYRLEVVDEGIGFDPDDRQRLPDHLGIRSMKERAAEQGGSVEINRGPVAGTAVVARIPVAESFIYPI